MFVCGGIGGGKAEAGAGFGFVGSEGEDGGEIGFAEVAGWGGVEDGFYAVLFGEARTGESGGERDFQRRNDYGRFADGVEVGFEIGWRELIVCAGVDGD